MFVKWLYRLEKRFGKLAIRNLMLYIVTLNALVFLFQYFGLGAVTDKLALYPELVLKGEVWRLITFIFIPPSGNIFLVLIALYFYYFIGTSLENEWGTFKFNVYYFVGMAATAAAAFVVGGPVTGLYLNTSLFLAFARLNPEFQILLFFIIPVKVKYLAWLNWAFIIYTVLNPFGYTSYKILAAVSVLNFLVFFGKDMINSTKNRGKSVYRRQKFSAAVPRDFTIHRCCICGITEKDDPKMDFRYCMLCEGDHEYCSRHLNTHEHIKKQA